MKISIQRLNEAVHMEAKNEDGVTLQMDGTGEIGGINGGFRPMQMLLAAAGGCSAIDVVGILQKQKQNPDDLKIEVTGERVNVKEYSEFKTVHIHFILKGAHLDEKKVARAIDLSINKYCSVSKTLEKTAKVTSSFEIVG
ncbi:MAG: OsmC family protein [Balneolaceae bacterium]|nr:OsmC family protein [Balneolaceae bacterium]MCH8550129.1 OsmC family protein [Balneolaceae bacterium]